MTGFDLLAHISVLTPAKAVQVNLQKSPCGEDSGLGATQIDGSFFCPELDPDFITILLVQ